MNSYLFILLVLFSCAGQAHDLATRDPFIPQKTDIGIAFGANWTSSSYLLGEIYGGMETRSCGFHCFNYLDLSARAVAQNGETDYQGSVGYRFQKYFDDSSWGPYLRPFLGLSHNIYSGPSGSQNLNLGFGGIAAGTFYYLHPGADLRLELGQGFGPQSWTYLSFGVVFKFRNI